jgi:hypothetical protein
MKKAVIALPKSLPRVIVISLVLSLALLGFQHVGFVSAVPEFSFSEIEAEIQVSSPVDNGSYTGDLSLNISIRYYALSHVPNSSVIPYQNINCLYQVDNNDWKNASRISASQQGGFWDPPNDGYWNVIDCNYSAVLQGLFNGEHLLDIDLKPDLEYHYRVASNETYVDNATISFFVFGNYDKPMPTATPTPTPSPSPSTSPTSSPSSSPSPTDTPSPSLTGTESPGPTPTPSIPEFPSLLVLYKKRQLKFLK